MASNNKVINAAIFVISLLLSSTTSSSACVTCNTAPPNKVFPNPPPAATESCPVNTSKLGVCAGLLGAHVVVGSPAYSQCCAILSGLGELEVAWCICTALKANVLGVDLNWTIDLELLLSLCKRPIPPGYKCA